MYLVIFDGITAYVNMLVTSINETILMQTDSYEQANDYANYCNENDKFEAK